LPCLVGWGKSTVRKWFEDLFENVSVAGDRLANFVAGERIKPYVPNDLSAVIFDPRRAGRATA
jgi:hypothetical protein